MVIWVGGDSGSPKPGGYGCGMDRARALSQLPEVYAAALRLRDAGRGSEAIATRLGMPVEAIAPLLRLAEAKLSRLLASDEPPPPNTGSD